MSKEPRVRRDKDRVLLGIEDDLPVVDEDELSDWMQTELDTAGFSPSVTIDDWYDRNPKKITITLEYKTGDGCDQPYGDYPPDEATTEHLEGGKFTVEYDGTMIYGYYCPKCENLALLDREEADYEQEGVLKCPKCKTPLQETRGSKWIRGYKTLELEGDETEEQIKELIEKTVNEVV